MGVPLLVLIARAYPQLIRISVTDARIAFSDPAARQRYSLDTPDRVHDWIEQYDCGNEVGTLSFILNTDEANEIQRC